MWHNCDRNVMSVLLLPRRVSQALPFIQSSSEVARRDVVYRFLERRIVFKLVGLRGVSRWLGSYLHP